MRDFFVVLPDQVKITWYKFLSWLDALALYLVDRYLASRQEERTVQLLDFEQIPILWDESKFPVISSETGANFGEIGGPEWAFLLVDDGIGVI